MNAAERKADIIHLREKHRDIAFHAFTNGTLIDQAFCEEMLRVGNFFVSVSIEGFEQANDGEFAGGCVAGGRIYCHINAAGDMEPCVFIHYSGANIREKSFLECLQQPLFLEYRKGQPFNGNHLRPCPMLENPELLPQIVARSGAHSTDLEAPESVEHLCGKCKTYAACWRPEAEKLWDEEHCE